MAEKKRCPECNRPEDQFHKEWCRHESNWAKGPGNELRCPRCWTLASKLETDDTGRAIDWCVNCQQPVQPKPL